MADPELWAANVAAYYERLSKFEPAVLARAFDGAWSRHKEWFPALGQMHELCVIARKEHTRNLPGLPAPRHDGPGDESAQNQEARRKASAYVRWVLGGDSGDGQRAEGPPPPLPDDGVES